MKHAHITISGRDIPLTFNLLAMEGVEETFGDMQKMFELLSGAKRTRTLIDLIVIMGNAALEEEGASADLTHSWVGAHMKPVELQGIDVVIKKALADGMRIEADEEAVHDVALEKHQKKGEAEA